jgi:hypothetical protein
MQKLDAQPSSLCIARRHHDVKETRRLTVDFIASGHIFLNDKLLTFKNLGELLICNACNPDRHSHENQSLHLQTILPIMFTANGILMPINTEDNSIVNIFIRQILIK